MTKLPPPYRVPHVYVEKGLGAGVSEGPRQPFFGLQVRFAIRTVRRYLDYRKARV